MWETASVGRCGRILTRLENYEDRRKSMKQICSACHSEQIVDRFFTSMDQGINLYNDKFGKPAKEHGQALGHEKAHADPYDEKIEWVFYELWHHEKGVGPRAFEMAPDYVHWWDSTRWRRVSTPSSCRSFGNCRPRWPKNCFETRVTGGSKSDPGRNRSDAGIL